MHDADATPGGTDPANDDLAVLLRREHDRLRALFDRAAHACSDHAARRRLFAQLEARLDRHFHLEERYVLPALARTDAAEAEALTQEHRELRREVAAIIGATETTSDRRVSAFLADLDAHALREESEAYRRAEQSLTEPVRAELRTHTRASIHELGELTLRASRGEK